MDQYGNNRKKIVFYSTDGLHAKLVAKMAYDGIKQAQFFMAVVEAYVDDNPDIRKFIENNNTFKIKERTKKQYAREAKKQKLLETKLNLSKEDIADIFDILAEDDDD